MKGDLLPEEDHVSRYCPPSQVEDGWPLLGAFQLKPAESYLSVNWLEYWMKSTQEEAIDCIRGEIALKRRPNGRFVVLNVGEVKQIVESVIRRSPTITHQPTPAMESHAGIFDWPADDEEIAAELRLLVGQGSIFPAIVV